jgi:hypothetical protein
LSTVCIDRFRSVRSRSGPGPEIQYGPTEYPGEPLRVDSLIEVGNRRIHVEFQLRANPAELEPRLVRYWSRLQTANQRAPEQHVVVLDSMGGRLSGRYEAGGLRLRYGAHHLWDVATETMLADPVLYPLAVLAQSGDREAVVRRVVQKARNEPNAREGEQIALAAATLASVYLDRPTRNSLLRRPNMPVDFRELPLIRELMEEGREEGLEQGLEQGRLEALVLVAEERFGALPADITQKILRGDLALPVVAHVVAQADSVDALREGLQ